LNAEISNVLTIKLKNFFALPHHHLGPVENVIISGQVVVLRIEENWIEERQRFRSSMRVALRDFEYEDKNRKMERPDIEVTVYARGMVEDMVPLVAQELMNKMLNFYYQKMMITGKSTDLNVLISAFDQTGIAWIRPLPKLQTNRIIEKV
jgi:hypothetical protein